MSEKDAGMQEEDKVDYHTRNMTTYATNIVADAFRLFSVLGIASREGSKGFWAILITYGILVVLGLIRDLWI